MTTHMRRLGAITGGVALFLIVIWYFAILSPQSKSLTKAHKARAAAEAQISQLQTHIPALNSLVKNIPQDKAKLAKYKQAVPDDPQLPVALDSIQSAASDTGVTLSMTDPSNTSGGTAAGGSPAASPAGGSGALPVLMTVRGSYPQVTPFISALTAMPRTVVINSLNITSHTGSAGSGAQAGLQVSLSTDLYYAGKPTP